MTYIISKKYAPRIRKRIVKARNVKQEIETKVKQEIETKVKQEIETKVKQEAGAKVKQEIETKVKQEEDIGRKAPSDPVDRRSTDQEVDAKVKREGQVDEPISVEQQKSNDVIFAAYGQMDGYPSGAGRVIADFLRDIDTEKFIDALERVQQYEGFTESGEQSDFGAGHLATKGCNNCECNSWEKLQHLPHDVREALYPEVAHQGAYLLPCILRGDTGRTYFAHTRAFTMANGCYVENARRDDSRRHLEHQITVAPKTSKSYATPTRSFYKKKLANLDLALTTPLDRDIPRAIERIEYHNGRMTDTDSAYIYVIDLDERTVLVIDRCGSAGKRIGNKDGNLLDLDAGEGCFKFTFDEFIRTDMYALDDAFELSNAVLTAGGMCPELLQLCTDARSHKVPERDHENHLTTEFDQADALAAQAAAKNEIE